jgi:protein-S-isoprenylcysteine O-methyltransferase Ste14
MLKRLVGSGDKIGLLLLPFLVGGLILNVAFPEFFAVGGPPAWLAAISAVVLVFGGVIWLWSVYLILTRVPRGELITSGPYRLMKHPLYTGVALLVLPWAGFLLNTWLGVVLGIVLYVGDRLYAPEEEAGLAATFGRRWEAYSRSVLLPWI